MSAGPESSADLVAVACVVEASLLLASEWSRVLIEYVYPLLKRLSELHPAHQFRLAFVTYGAADTRPKPLLSTRFFAPLSHVTKELREEPSKLGIGQTNSGGGRGLSALEGLVAAIELFDILMTSTANHAQTQTPQKENRSLISHLLHIAASPPDNVQKPHCNTLQHLDSVNWESIPTELKKRKINLSLISLRKIPQFQDLQSLVAGPGAQSPWFNVRVPHILLLAGFPTPQKTGAKRQTDALSSDQSPDTKRQKVTADPVSKTSSASPALSSARIPQNQRSQQPLSSQVPQPSPMTVSGQRSSPAQPVQPTTSVPASTPASATPSASLPPSGPSISAINAEIFDHVVTASGLKFGQMMERFKALEREIVDMDSQISNAQNAGQPAIVAELQKDRTRKAQFNEQIKSLLKQYYQKICLAKEAPNVQATALPNGSAEAGPSTQSHLPNGPGASSERPMDPKAEVHQPTVADSQVLAKFWQSRGGTISTPNSNNPQASTVQVQSHPTVDPDAAAQMQKLIEKGIRPQNFGPSSQTTGTSHETGVKPNATSVPAPTTPAWHGTFLWTPKLNGQVTNELQIQVVGVVPSHTLSDFRTDTWPKNLTLNTCKEPLKDNTELPNWVKRHKSQAHLMRFVYPRPPDGSVNEQKFHTLYKFMTEHRVYAYAGWQLPSGKFSYNIVIFPMASCFAGAVFPNGLPDLPGSGNVLDVQPPVEEAKPRPLSGMNLPPAWAARMQGLEPAKQKQLLAHLIRARHQEQLRLQQLQQSQQHSTASSQTLNSLGVSMPPNTYSTGANPPASSHANVSGPMNSGAYNAGGGTVNDEMLKSFMRRSAEGSTSQGMNSGQVS